MIIKLIEYLIFGSIFIALCAVGMCIETNMLLHLPLNNLSFYAFVFGATLAQYNMHYLIKKRALADSKRFQWSSDHKGTHLIFFISGLIFIAISLFSFHVTHFLLLAVMSVISLLYSLPFLPFKNKKRIKDFGLLKIITLALLWTLVTVWFPVVELPFPIISFQLIFIRRFLFIFILCLMFDIRDKEVDGTSGIKTLPVVLGLNTCLIICYAGLALFTILSAIQYNYYHNKIELVSMILSVISTVILVFYGRKKRGDYYYLAGIDGMMLLQAVFVILGHIFFT